GNLVTPWSMARNLRRGAPGRYGPVVASERRQAFTERRQVRGPRRFDAHVLPGRMHESQRVAVQRLARELQREMVGVGEAALAVAQEQAVVLRVELVADDG